VRAGAALPAHEADTLRAVETVEDAEGQVTA
jgi:hypothetical protein